jgi:hypothetical protein
MDITPYYKETVQYITTVHPYIYNSVGIYGIWIGLHYGATHLYATSCNNWSITGFLASPIMNSTPYCKGLNWIIRTGSDTIDTMWVTVGTWMSGYLLNKSLFSAK